MRSYILISTFLLGFTGFSQGIKEPFATPSYRSFAPPTASYDDLKQKIINHKQQLKTKQIDLDSCKRYFLHMFEYEVFPHWVGTKWDYNGYTNVPGKGKLVACGYFVSTPLKHMGFNWNRFKLAQMYSKNIVETLCQDMKHYTDKQEMINELNQRENHLYIVGLDNHVGMLLKSRGEIWFVHSNYIGLKGPDQELAELSLALDSSESYYVGTFTSDTNMKKWLDGSIFPTE